MATNVRFDKRAGVRMEMDLGGAVTGGNVRYISQMQVFVLEDTDANNKATVELIGVSLVVDLSVHGADGVGDTAVAVGDAIYLDGTEYNADDTNGTIIGYALEPVSSGATTVIKVALAALSP